MIVENEALFIREAQSFANRFKPGGLILMSGLLGVGKTLWIRSVVESLGGKWVSSPSFSVIQQYQTKIGPIGHVDLYRMESERDIESTGFWDLFHEPGLTVFVEWPDRVPSHQWPRDREIWRVALEFVTDAPLSRTVTTELVQSR